MAEATKPNEQPPPQSAQSDSCAPPSSSSSQQRPPPPPAAAAAADPLITLEPAILLLFTAFSISGTIWTNQIIYQTCTVRFGYATDECSQLGTPNASHTIETDVQPYAARILMTRQLVESIGPAVLGLFIGPWSDRFGRKPVILCTLGGYLCSYAISGAVAWLSSVHPTAVSPWAYVLAAVPVALTGGYCALLTGMFCYMADVTSTKNRAMRMSFMEGAIFIGFLAGNMSSSWMFRHTSTTVVFAVAALLTLLATVHVVFSVSESIRDDAQDRRLGGWVKFGALFDVTLVAEIFGTCLRRREQYERPVLLLTMLCLVSGIFVMGGNDTVFYMFVREKFEWTIEQFNDYDSTAIISQVCGNVFGLYVLRRCCGLSDTTLACVAFVSYAADYTIKAIASQPWHLYAGLSVAFLKCIGSPMCRTILASCVPTNEVGKVYALTTAMETLTTLVAAPLYTAVYASTLAFYPGAFNMISAAMYVFVLMVMILVKIIMRRDPLIATGISYGPISDD